MSQEQWGHGYWQGVRDAINGTVRTSVKDRVFLWYLLMTKRNALKKEDKSLFAVSDLYTFISIAGLDAEEYTREVYNYVYYHGEEGSLMFNFGNAEFPNYQLFYISGNDDSDMLDDYFVIQPPENVEQIDRDIGYQIEIMKYGRTLK